MAYKFQLGKAKLSGSIETAQVITSQGGLIVNGDVDLDAGVINNTELSGGITNDKLVNNTVKFNGVTVALGESGSFGTDAVTEGSTNKYYLDSRARTAVSVTDAGGDGSLTYNSGSGVFTYTGPSAAEARAHFSADGQGIEYASATGQFSLELTGASLLKNASGLQVDESWVRGRFGPGSGLSYVPATGIFSVPNSGITNAMLASSSVTINGTAGEVTVVGSPLALGGTATVSLPSTISKNLTFTGQVTMENLNITGTLTTVNATNLEIKDARILMASGSTAFATDVGIDFGSHVGHATLLTAEVNIDSSGSAENVLSSSLPLVAPAVKATSFYGNLVGSMQLNVVPKAENYTILSGDNVIKATANITLNLPVGPAVGQEHRIKCYAADPTASVIIVPQVGGTIEGLSQVVLESYGAAISLVWDGSAWMVF